MRRSTSVPVAGPQGPFPTPHPIAPKYVKIQPAIAPKPAAPGQKAAFSPHPLSQTKVFMMQRTTSDSNVSPGLSFQVNTSKKWVLPPRPRAGRRNHEELKEVTKAKDACKKKPRARPKREEIGVKAKNHDPTSMLSPANVLTSPTSLASDLSFPSCLAKAETNLPLARNDHSGRFNPPDSLETTQLKQAYLSKLKEQDMIYKYIDVISKQIKELRFVQNGVITRDTLHKCTASTDPVPVDQKEKEGSSAVHDQLASINNLNDLNLFLSYLTTSSSVLRSAMKKDALLCGPQDGYNLDAQIQHYTDMRARTNCRDRAARGNAKRIGANSNVGNSAIRELEKEPASVCGGWSSSLARMNSSLESTPAPDPQEANLENGIHQTFKPDLRRQPSSGPSAATNGSLLGDEADTFMQNAIGVFDQDPFFLEAQEVLNEMQ